jgi:hypothetical protein
MRYRECDGRSTKVTTFASYTAVLRRDPSAESPLPNGIENPIATPPCLVGPMSKLAVRPRSYTRSHVSLLWFLAMCAPIMFPRIAMRVRTQLSWMRCRERAGWDSNPRDP